MLQKRNVELENEILNKIVDENPEIKKEHELFLEEMKFKQQLLEARRAQEMTQKEISEISGLSQQAVSRLEKGKGATIETVLKYLNAIGFTLVVKKM